MRGKRVLLLILLNIFALTIIGCSNVKDRDILIKIGSKEVKLYPDESPVRDRIELETPENIKGKDALQVSREDTIKIYNNVDENDTLFSFVLKNEKTGKTQEMVSSQTHITDERITDTYDIPDESGIYYGYVFQQNKKNDLGYFLKISVK